MQVARATWEKTQPHVFKHVAQLDSNGKAELVSSLDGITLQLVKELYDVYKDSEAGHVKSEEKDTLEPFMNVTIRESIEKEVHEKWHKAGMKLIAEGKAAALLMAGGQGTRLGSDLPKGQYNIGMPSQKSLFQLQAERIITLRRLAGNLNDDHSPAELPWYIMTSPATHAPTVEFFEKNNYFGLRSTDVKFFKQATLPSITKEGKLMMETTSRVARSPNGNGGIYEAALVEGIIDDIRSRGVEFIFIYSVDNALVQVCDPEFLGYCAENNIDFGNKVLEKTDPTESVGVLAMKNGKPAVIEYSELSKTLAAERSTDGRLVYGAANIAIHCFSADFFELSANASLPYHIAHKKIPVIDDTGKQIKPTANNGMKMEKFIFDGLALAQNPGAYMVPRFGNFTAVKNAPGQNLPDSPDTARADVSAYHASLLEAAGAIVEKVNDPKKLYEISPLVSYNGEGLADRVKGKKLVPPVHIQ